MAPSLSRQPRTSKKVSPNYFWTFFEATDPVPPWGSSQRIDYLRKFSQEEPILSGAVFSMVSKMISSDWRIVGGRNKVRPVHELLAYAEDGKGWQYFLDRFVQDYLRTDVGGYVEKARFDTGVIGGLYNIDAATVELTGDPFYPIKYRPAVGGGSAIPLSPLDFSCVVDLPSSDETKLGLGYCAVSRSLKVGRILYSLYTYEEERLKGMPPQAIASITGLTHDEVQEAFDTYESQRASKKETTFKGVLWMAALDDPTQTVDVKLTPLSGIPEHFNREQAITMYVYTLALDFGVDIREFWPASQVGATKAEAEVQASKARTKGPGRLYASIERMINFDICPPGVTFGFVKKDSEEDIVRETHRQMVIGNVRRLWEPATFSQSESSSVIGGSSGSKAVQETDDEDESGQSQSDEDKESGDGMQAQGWSETRTSSRSEGLITTDEARRLLVEWGALPEWLGQPEEEVAYSLQQKQYLSPGEPLVAIDAQGVETVVSKNVTYSFPLSMLPVSFPSSVG